MAEGYAANGHEVVALTGPPLNWQCSRSGRGVCADLAEYRVGYRYHHRERGYVWRDLYVCRRHAEMFATRHNLEMPEIVKGAPRETWERLSQTQAPTVDCR